MRNQVLCSVLGMAALFLVNGCQKPVVDPPTLKLDKTEFAAKAEGEVVSVPYTLANAVEGSGVSVNPVVEGGYGWAEVTRISASAIDVTVLENETLESRTAEFTVSYPGISADAKFSIVQAAGEAPAPEYDHDNTLSEFSGTFYESYGNNGEDNYTLVFSDLPLIDDYYTQTGGTYYQLDMYAPVGSGNVIPTGTYTVGASGSTDPMTVSPDSYTWYRYQGADDASTVERMFVSGSVEVSAEGDVYTFEAVLTDDAGETHHFVYTGPAELDGGGGGDEPGYDAITEPLDIDASIGQAVFVAEDGTGVMNVTMQFTDMPVDNEGYVVPPGTILSVDAYMPYDEDGKIALGTYNVEDTYESMSVSPGMDFYGLFSLGSYATYYPDENSYALGYISSGSMEVSGDPDAGQYTITCNFVTAEGVSIKCDWSGSMSVLGMFDSTLESDYTLDLDGAVGTGYYYGDFYGTGGGNWMITLNPASDVGDGLQVDLVAEGLDFAAGIPSGTYTAQTSDYPVAGEYATGYIDGNYLQGTWYVDQSLYGLEGYAPAVSGDLDITNHGDGTYTLEFSHLDDKGYTWSGSWTGAIEMSDKSEDMGYSAASVATKSASSMKSVFGLTSGGRGAVTPEQKAEFLKDNGLKTPEVSAVQARSHKMSVRK